MVQHHQLHGQNDGAIQNGGTTAQQQLDLQGRIMWLPEKTVDLGFKDDIYNHPVVVLSPQDSSGVVDFLMLTSFGGTNLGQRNTHRRQGYLPIWPSEPHPDNSKLLRLSNLTDQLKKNSYVKIKPVYTTDLANLRDYRVCSKRPLHLSRDSYSELVASSNYSVTVKEFQLRFNIARRPPVAPKPASLNTVQSSLDHFRSVAFTQQQQQQQPQLSPLYSHVAARRSSHLVNLPDQQRLALARALPSSIGQGPFPSHPQRLRSSPPHKPFWNAVTSTPAGERSPLLAGPSTRQTGPLRQLRQTQNYGSSEEHQRQHQPAWPSRDRLLGDALLVLLCFALFLGACYGVWLLLLAIGAAVASAWSAVVQTGDAWLAAVGEAAGSAWEWVSRELAMAGRAVAPWQAV